MLDPGPGLASRLVVIITSTLSIVLLCRKDLIVFLR